MSFGLFGKMFLAEQTDEWYIYVYDKSNIKDEDLSGYISISKNLISRLNKESISISTALKRKEIEIINANSFIPKSLKLEQKYDPVALNLAYKILHRYKKTGKMYDREIFAS